MSTNDQSNLAEAIFRYKFTRMGVPVCIPTTNNLPYDMVIDLSGKLCKVQIKSATSGDGVIKVKLQRTYTLSAKSVYRNYVEGDFDYVAVYDTTEDKCYLVPAIHCINKATLYLRVEKAKNGAEKGILYASTFLLDVALLPI